MPPSSSRLKIVGTSLFRNPGGRYAPVATGFGDAVPESVAPRADDSCLILCNCTTADAGGAGDRLRGKENCDGDMGRQATFWEGESGGVSEVQSAAQ